MQRRNAGAPEAAGSQEVDRVPRCTVPKAARFTQSCCVLMLRPREEWGCALSAVCYVQDSAVKREPGPILKGEKYIGIYMNRPDAVNSALTNFVTVPQKTASLLMEAWDARHSVCLIVSERTAENLFVRSFLFHESYIVTAEPNDHVRIARLHRAVPHGQPTTKWGSSSILGMYRM